MRYEIIVRQTDSKVVPKSDYREIGKKENGDPLFKYVSREENEDVTVDILRFSTDVIDLTALMRFLAQEKV